MRNPQLLACLTLLAGCTGHQTFDDGSDAVMQSPQLDRDAGGEESDEGAAPGGEREPDSADDDPAPQPAPVDDEPMANGPTPGPTPSPVVVGPPMGSMAMLPSATPSPQPFPTMEPAGVTPTAMPGVPVGMGGGPAANPNPDCTELQCFRAIECVEECGGPVLQASCCPCEGGTFDSIECDMSQGGSASGGASSGGAPSGGAASGGTAGEGGAAAGGAAGAVGYDPEDLNTECVEGGCPEGLTPVVFYGIAGPPEPEFCWCSIPCDEDPEICPENTSCVTISDGPGLVCYADEPAQP